MAELPSGLLEACVVVGASSEKLRDIYQNKSSELPLLEAEVLQIHAPPFVSKETNSSQVIAPAFSRVQKRRSFIRKKKRDRGTDALPNVDSLTRPEGASTSEDISVPKDLDLIALPQLCFPGGLQLASEQREDSYHYLVFTDLFGNRTHGVVVQYYRAVQNGGRPKSRLYAAIAVCIISKFPFYHALRDCLSCLLVQLRTLRQGDFEETVKEFSAKLSLVPLPPPGSLHVSFSLRPLQVLLPSREDPDGPLVDMDLHLPLLCFSHTALLQVLSCLLQEQRMVFFSSDWSKLTLVAESLLLYLQPLSWQQPYVPVLARGMLDFLMAPTAFLMGCHISHLEDIAAETEDLILVNIDDGIVQSSWSDTVDLPSIPVAAAESFLSRAECLQIHYDLDSCHTGAATDVNAARSQRRDWQRQLNSQIQNLALELVVNTFRGVQDFLNYEHRVFNSKEFLRTREPADQLFYQKVLETHIFHSFLRDRLNRKLDAFSRMEQKTLNLSHRNRAMTESPRRPPLPKVSRNGLRTHTSPNPKLSKRLGASLPNLDQPLNDTMASLVLDRHRPQSARKMTPDVGLKSPLKVMRVFHLPEFPPPLSYLYVKNYYSDMAAMLGKALNATPPDESAVLARYHYLRGLVNTVSNRHLDALEDFQCLYKTDAEIFPSQMVKSLVDSMPKVQRIQAEKRPEIKGLISRVIRDQERERQGQENRSEEDGVKHFQLPKKYLHLEEFVKCVQESGIVKDQGTILRLFDALTVGHQKQVGPDLFKDFYTIWKETEAEAQEVCLPASVLDHIETGECVFKLSSSVKTSHGVGKIAMTQRRLFLLTDGRPGYVEVAQYRDLEEVKVSSAPFLLLKIPSLKLRVKGKKETFEANLKTETELWNLMIKEMWAGRFIADQHKDPQYMQQALTNALLMDAVVGCLQSSKAVYAASKLAHFDREEVQLTLPKTTTETLKHKINPSLELAAPQAIEVLYYTLGQLWVSLGGGMVMVFDASSWSLTHTVQVGNARLSCMLAVTDDQVWMGSEDSVIYIISVLSMVCNRQLTDHRAEVTGLALDLEKYSHKVAYSCSAEGTVLVWDVPTLQVRKRFRLSCDRLQAVHCSNGMLWCCSRDSVMEVWRNGSLKNRVLVPDQQRGSISAVVVLSEREELWAGFKDSADVLVWGIKDTARPVLRLFLPDCSGCFCMIPVKNQVWIGAAGRSSAKGKVYIVDSERYQVLKELQAHSDRVTTLCSAEDRYVLSGAAKHDGKIAIWKVE